MLHSTRSRLPAPAPQCGGALQQTRLAGELTAIGEALRQVLERVPWPPDGVTMRVGEARAAALVLGMQDGHTSPEPDLVAEARALVARVRHGGHQLWWAGFPDDREYVWADRAHAMAVHGLGGPWGALGARWAGWARHLPPAGGSAALYALKTSQTPSRHPTDCRLHGRGCFCAREASGRRWTSHTRYAADATWAYLGVGNDARSVPAGRRPRVWSN